CGPQGCVRRPMPDEVKNTHEHFTPDRSITQWPAAWRIAVPVVGGADVGAWHYEAAEPEHWLRLHGGRLYRSRGLWPHRLLPGCRRLLDSRGNAAWPFLGAIVL